MKKDHLPSIIGQSRSAHLSTFMPHMPRGDFGQSLSGSGNALTNALGAAVSFYNQQKGEGESLALAKAQADYMEELTQKGNREVYSLKGIAAGDASSLMERIELNAKNRQLEALSKYAPNVRERFNIFATKMRTSHISHSLHYGRDEVRRATVQESARVMESAIQTFGNTGYLDNLEEALSSHDKSYQTTRGRLVDTQWIEKFDSNLKSGFVFWGGEKLKVVDEIKPGDKGVIARNTALEVRAKFAKEAQDLKNSRQALIDTAHTTRINQFLQYGQLQEARDYLTTHEFTDPKYQMSDNAYDRLDEKVARHTQIIDTQAGAKSYFDEVIATGAKLERTMGGRYWTNEMDQTALDITKELNDKARNGDSKAAKELSVFNSYINAKRGECLAQEKLDIISEQKRLTEAGLFEPANIGDLGLEIAKLPDSPVKDAMANSYAKLRRAQEEEIANNPESKKGRLAVVQEFKRYVSTEGVMSIGKHKFDFSKPEGIKDAMKFQGLTKSEQQEVKVYLNNRRIPYEEAARITAQALNQAVYPDAKKGDVYFTPQSVSLVCPELLQHLEWVAKCHPAIDFKTANGKDFMRGEIIRYLKAMQTQTPGALWGKNNMDLITHLKKAVDKEGAVVDGNATFSAFYNLTMTPEQRKKEQEYYESVRAFAENRAPNLLNTSSENKGRRPW